MCILFISQLLFFNALLILESADDIPTSALLLASLPLHSMSKVAIVKKELIILNKSYATPVNQKLFPLDSLFVFFPHWLRLRSDN